MLVDGMVFFVCAFNYFFASFHCNGVYWISLFFSCKNNELEYAKFFGSPDDSQCRLFTLLYYVSNVYDTSYAGQENLYSHEKQRKTTDRPCALTKYIIYKYYSEKGGSQIIEYFPPFIWIFYGFSMFFFHVFVFRSFAVIVVVVAFTVFQFLDGNIFLLNLLYWFWLFQV